MTPIRAFPVEGCDLLDRHRAGHDGQSVDHVSVFGMCGYVLRLWLDGNRVWETSGNTARH